MANRVTEDEIEILHIAVRPKYQKSSIGSTLVKQLIRGEITETPVKVLTWARNTSTGFFAKLGFEPTGKFIEHKAFSKYGIKFQQMFLDVR